MKYKNTFFSIIVASFNYDEYIITTLESIAKQTYKNFEVIIVDDGSTDNSVSIIKEFCNNNPQFKLYTHENNSNKGLKDTILLGLSKAKGDFIAFCESDDYWSDDHLEEIEKSIQANPNAKFFANAINLVPYNKDADKYLILCKKALEKNPSTYYKSLCERNIFGTFSAIAIEKKALLECDFNSYVQAWLDYWIIKQILIKYEAIYINKKLTYWRIHDNSYNKREYNELLRAKFHLVLRMLLFKKNPLLFLKKERYFFKKENIFNLKNIFYLNNLYINKQKYKNIKILGLPFLFKDTEKFSNKKEFKKFIKYTKKLKTNKSNILLVTHEFSATGAPLAVLNTAISLKEQGHNVIIIGLANQAKFNNYRYYCKKEYIPCFSSTLFKGNNLDFKYLKVFDFIFVNCAYSYPIIKTLIENNYSKYLWRISEADIIKNSLIQIPEFKYSKKKKKNIYAVSNLTKNILAEYNNDIKLLLYGVKDVSTTYKKQFKNNDTLRIMIIGSIQYRKAQYLCLYALNLLPPEIKDKIKLCFIGETTKEFEAFCHSNANNIENFGYLEGKDKYKIMSNCDICLCPSTDDPNPQAVMEAMMLKKPCIVTDKVGQAQYIQNKSQGLVIPSNDSRAIADAIQYMVLNKHLLPEMGKNSYELYKKYFSYDKYTTQVKDIIKSSGVNLCKY